MLEHQFEDGEYSTPDELKSKVIDRIADEFWNEMEEQAAKYEVTVDYYIAEFYC